MSRVGIAFLALLLLAGPARAAGRDLADARIAGLEGRVRGNELLVSFRLENAFPEELVERLHSGIAIKFRHKVDMVLRRPFFLIPNKLLERTVVETDVAYDSLTRQYSLRRRTETKTKRKQGPPIDLEIRKSTESLEEVIDWFTVVSDVPLTLRSGVRGSDRVRVQVTSTLGRRLVLLMFPSSYSVSAELRLEF